MKRSLTSRFTASFAIAVGLALFIFSGAVVLVMVISEKTEVHYPGQDIEAAAEEDVQRILFSIAVLAPFAVAGAGVMGRLLARRAVRPLIEATARVRAAQSSDELLTLPLSGQGDEWDDLATVLNALLAERNASLDRIRTFTADAAHELRTPLATILGEAEVTLRRDRTVDELRETLVRVQRDAQQLASILDALLVLARADSATILSGRDECDMLALAQEVAVGVASELPGAAPDAIHVEGSPAVISANRVLVTRLLRNLVENGVRYGGGRVDIRIIPLERGVTLRVTDYGKGVPEAVRASLFRRFVRGDEARSTTGLGLGLAIARAVAEAHGGNLELVSSEKGALFEAFLPTSPQGASLHLTGANGDGA